MGENSGMKKWLLRSLFSFLSFFSFFKLAVHMPQIFAVNYSNSIIPVPVQYSTDDDTASIDQSIKHNRYN